MDLQRRFVALKNFLERHNELLQSEVLNHYPNELPPPYQEWAAQLRDLSEASLIQAECFQDSLHASGGLKDYLDELKELLQFPTIQPSEETTLSPNVQRGMTLKKRHEARAIKNYLHELKYTSFVDIGSGKGHLSMALLHDREGKSLCLDMDEKLQKAGLKKIKEHCPELAQKLTFKKVRFESSSKLEPDEESLLLGLHCCGDLSVEAMEYHLAHGTDLLSFGCCYHKSKKLNLSSLAKMNPLQFSHHALTLASRSNRVLTSEDFRRRKRVKVYRYILHMILTDETGAEFETLGNAHHSDYDLEFEEYCSKYAPEALKLDLKKLFPKYLAGTALRDCLLAETFRAPLGRALELYILLDRALYLQETGKKVESLAFFDRELSPRNIGIFSKSV